MSSILQELGAYLFILYPLVVIIIMIRLLLDDKPPEVLIAWLFAVYFLPYVGVVLYLLGGVNWKKRKIMKQLPEKTFKTELGDILEKQNSFMKELTTTLDNDVAKSITLALRSGNAIVTLNNSVEIFSQGAPMFSRLCQDLEKAGQSIHMEYFIFNSDELGQGIEEILARKAAQGVEVRLIFDGVGCFRRMSKSFKRKMVRDGLQTRYFLDPVNVLSGRLLNYCNHRKIAVIDGKTAYTGGMNIGMEYITGGSRFSSWRDTHIRLEGESVSMLQSVFLSDWHNSGGELIHHEKYFPGPEERGDYLPTQIVCSGPDSDWEIMEKLFFNMIVNANRKVYIQTPYFIPDTPVLTAIETAALSGVEVKLMMTGIPDKRVPFWVAHNYFDVLIQAGVEIYLYERGFFHPKVIIVDDNISTVGSCNMDIRSFHLDYEINAFFYDRAVSRDLVRLFREDLKECRQITAEECRNVILPVRLRNSLFKLVAPVL